MKLVRALELTGTTSRDVWKPYWASQQRFFKLLCISMKVPSLLGRGVPECHARKGGAAADRGGSPNNSDPA